MIKPKLIIIRGYSGTGKSTVSKMFAEKYRWALIKSDYFFFGINPYHKHPKSDYEITFDNILDCIKNYMEKNKNIIIEGALVAVNKNDPVDIRKLINLGKRHGYKIFRFVFVAKKKVTTRRMKKRKHIVPDWAYNTIRRKVNKSKSKNTIVIDTSNYSVKQIINKIEKIVFM